MSVAVFMVWSGIGESATGMGLSSEPSAVAATGVVVVFSFVFDDVVFVWLDWL